MNCNEEGFDNFCQHRIMLFIYGLPLQAVRWSWLGVSRHSTRRATWPENNRLAVADVSLFSTNSAFDFWSALSAVNINIYNAKEESLQACPCRPVQEWPYWALEEFLPGRRGGHLALYRQRPMSVRSPFVHAPNHDRHHKEPKLQTSLQHSTKFVTAFRIGSYFPLSIMKYTHNEESTSTRTSSLWWFRKETHTKMHNVGFGTFKFVWWNPSMTLETPSSPSFTPNLKRSNSKPNLLSTVSLDLKLWGIGLLQINIKTNRGVK